MAVHACVKGFGGEVFLWLFNTGVELKNSGRSFPETLNDKRIKRKWHILTFMHTQASSMYES